MKKVGRVLTVIFGILMVIGGFYCLFTPAITYLSVGYAVGLIMVVDAVAGFINWNNLKQEGMGDGWMLFGAILSLVFGIFVLGSDVLQLGVDVFLVYYIATWLVVYGVVVIIRALRMKRLHRKYNTAVIGTRSGVSVLLGILMIVFGVLSFMNPLVIAAAIGIFIGLGVIACGANLITWGTMPDPKN